jgi:hypothetical protein
MAIKNYFCRADAGNRDGNEAMAFDDRQEALRQIEKSQAKVAVARRGGA